MEIRKKITYQFIGIVALILLLSSIAVYISFSETRKEEFYDRLTRKAKLAAQMLIEIDEIDADLLRRIEENNPLSLPNEKIIIYDMNNREIYSNDDENSILISNDLVEKVKEKGELKIAQNSFEILGYYYSSQNENVVVFTAATDIFGLSKLEQLQVILVVVFIIGLIIIFISGRIFATRALKPISNIISQVDKIGITNLNERVDEGNGKDELARLAATFNKMLQRLEVSFESQKNFIANASHELHTPLTVLTGQLEVLLLKSRSVEEYEKTLDDLLVEIKNLTNITNKLLLLAQTGSNISKVSFSRFRIDDTLWQARNEILRRNNDYVINIHFSDKIDSDEKLIVYGNSLLLKIAFSNIIENACKYSNEKKVDVHLDDIHNNYIPVKFIDQGIGIPGDEVKMIFQPFYRSKRVINIPGHGMGLSLVEKIIAMHKGNITIESSPSKGSIFTVKIPLEA